jgi:hypothetical protein
MPNYVTVILAKVFVRQVPYIFIVLFYVLRILASD